MDRPMLKNYINLTEICWGLEINVFKQYIINVVWKGCQGFDLDFFVGFLVLFICKDCAGIMAEISNSCAISTLRTTSQPLLLDYAN